MYCLIGSRSQLLFPVILPRLGAIIQSSWFSFHSLEMLRVGRTAWWVITPILGGPAPRALLRRLSLKSTPLLVEENTAHDFSFPGGLRQPQGGVVICTEDAKGKFNTIKGSVCGNGLVSIQYDIFQPEVATGQQALYEKASGEGRVWSPCSSHSLAGISCFVSSCLLSTHIIFLFSLIFMEI